MGDPFVHSEKETGNYWVSISDLMSGLMLIFLAIALFFMLQIRREQRDIEGVALVYDTLRIDLYDSLYDEFKDDLVEWGAEIDKETLSVRFKEPDVLFDSGESGLKPLFVNILNDFFPRYLQILKSPDYEEHIEEVRIEGHTSSFWAETTGDIAYMNNMVLSQRRTRSVLNHVLFMRHDYVLNNKEWLKSRITANGLSSSKLVFVNGVENRPQSQRVEFRIRTDAEDQMNRILSQIER